MSRCFLAKARSGCRDTDGVERGLSKEADAQAIRFQLQGAAAAGQGNAFAASVDDASAVYYNPAGLSRGRGLHSMVGINLVGGAVTVRDQTGSEIRGDFNGAVSWPPQVSFTSVPT